MATINSQSFNAGSSGAAGVYAPGDPVELTTNFAPDAPSVVAEQFITTTTITNSAGVQVAASNASFAVNQPQAGGDVEATTDSGGHAWAAGAAMPQADGSLTQVDSTVA